MAPPNKQRNKNRPPKMTTQTLLDFDLGESSSDSDFRIEDHTESDDDFSENSNEEDSCQDDEEEDETETEDDSDSDSSDNKNLLMNSSLKKSKETVNYKDIIEKSASISALNDRLPTNPICCACLGDRSDDTNEIVECDGCGVSVHEGCYGVSDSTSISSTVSSCSTEPWFCEACRAGILNPSCELCPNKGGIFKETDVGKWVHLVCALYVPGVAFGEVDQLSSVTLFEMPYSKWGAKTCTLCEDAKFARTGVCIGCDAGMCKTYFHVTCAQAAGFLSEAHSEEADHADPFYAHCKVHSDKSMIKHRKRNYNTLKIRMEQRKLNKMENQNEKPTTEKLRIQRKLTKYQTKYKTNKILKNEPWVPTQKMPRLLTTSATACRRLMLKAELMGIDTVALEFQEAQMVALADVRRKWHIPPAFSVEFIGYYLDRITRIKDLKSNLERHMEMNKKLLEEQQNLREEYDQKTKQNIELTTKNTKLKENVNELHKQIQSLCPDKTFPSIDNIGRPVMIPSPAPPSRPMSVPTAAALKMGVGFPLINLSGGTKDDTGRILSTQRQNNDDLVHECGICKRCNDQHLLAKCDTCHFYYHLGCLNPPLTRHPKKSKLYGWQCSECDKSDDSDGVVDIPKGPRKSRTRFSKDGSIVPCDQNTSSNTESNISGKSDTSTSSKHRKSLDKIKKEQSIEDIDFDMNKSIPIRTAISPITATKGQQKEDNQTKVAISSHKSISKNKQSIKHQQINNESKPKQDVQSGQSSLVANSSDKNKINLQKFVKENTKNKTAPQDSTAEESAAESTTSSKTKEKIKMRKGSKKLKRERLPQSRDEENTDCGDQSEIKKSKIDNNCKEEKASPVIIEKNSVIENLVENENTKKEELKDENVKIENLSENGNKEIKENRIENEVKTEIEQTDEKEQKLNHKEGDIKKKITENEEENNKVTEQQNVDPSHKQNRKRRKEKHKNKYGSDHEKSPGKEHKRKRKKKSHDRENIVNDVPKIKIKLKPLPLPGEAAPEPQFFYVSADMVRDNSRPTSVETIDESTTNADDIHLNSSPAFLSDVEKLLPSTSTPNPSSRINSPIKFNNISKTSSLKSLSIGKQQPARILSPRRSSKRDSISNTNQNSKQTSSTTAATVITEKLCDVCAQSGNNQNLVQCDECDKSYHFTCLDPPLKKTPKRRGYSWHCADCDPTDHESV